MRIRRALFTSFVVVLVALSARSAGASPIRWRFSGWLGNTGASALAIPVGSPLEWTVWLNPSAHNQCDDGSGQGRYDSILKGTLRIGPWLWTGGQGVVEVNTIAGACGGPSPTGVSFREFDWSAANGFPDAPLAVFGSLRYPGRLDGILPDVPPPGALFIWSGSSHGGFDAQTEVSAVSAVPEPATLTLIGTGAAAIFFRRRRA